jgi:hypothetical protein
MTKEKVIIFEGEHNFVTPKNRVRNKKTGMSHYVPSEMNVIAPVGVGVLDAPIEPPIQPDEPMGSPKTTTTLQDAAKIITSQPADVTLAPKNTLLVNDANVTLGGARTLLPSDEQMQETKTTTTTTPIIPLMQIDLGVSPSAMRSGGGGGGGAKEEAAKKKTFLQKYWWIFLIAAVGGGAAYYKYKKKK